MSWADAPRLLSNVIEDPRAHAHIAAESGRCCDKGISSNDNGCAGRASA